MAIHHATLAPPAITASGAKLAVPAESANHQKKQNLRSIKLLQLPPRNAGQQPKKARDVLVIPVQVVIAGSMEASYDNILDQSLTNKFDAT